MGGSTAPSGGRLAQLVERFVYTEDVGSSSLSSPTISTLESPEVTPGPLFSPRGKMACVNRQRAPIPDATTISDAGAAFPARVSQSAGHPALRARPRRMGCAWPETRMARSRITCRRIRLPSRSTIAVATVALQDTRRVLATGSGQTPRRRNVGWPAAHQSHSRISTAARSRDESSRTVSSFRQTGSNPIF